MKKFRFKMIGIDLEFEASDDIAEVYERDCGQFDAKWEAKCLLETFLRGSGLYAEYIKAYASRIRRKKWAMILAHGGVDEGDYVYSDGRETRSIQDWVSEKDGKYACLFIASCNKAGLTPTAKRSLLFLPDWTFNVAGRASMGRETIFSIFSPLHGEVDSSNIEWCLEKIKGQVDKDEDFFIY